MQSRSVRSGLPGGDRKLPEEKGDRRVLAVLAAVVFLAALDQTMVVTILPPILTDLNIPLTRLDDAAWIVTGYLLGYTVAMPLFGRLADVYGRRPVFAASIGIFMVGSLLCALAGGLTDLVGYRILQAVGGGAVVPIAMAGAAASYSGGRRAFALGVIGASAEAGSVMGPLYGATLAHMWGWRAIFLINIPLGLILVVWSWKLLSSPLHAHPFRGDAADSGDESRGVDYGGAFLLAVSLAALAIGLGGTGAATAGEGGVPASGSALGLPWLAGAAIAFAVFILHQLRHPEPLVRLSMFKSIPFSAANLAHLAVGGALVVGMVEIPLWSYSLLGSSELEGGLLLMRLTALIPIGALFGGWLADRVGYRTTSVVGFGVTAAGYWLISTWSTAPDGLTMTRDLMITGTGLGLVIAPIFATVISSVGARWMATGAALVTVMRILGMMIGLSTLSSRGIRHFYSLMSGTDLPLRTPGMSDAQYQTLVNSYQSTLDAALHTVFSEFFLAAAVMAALAIIPALFFPSRDKGAPRRPDYSPGYRDRPNTLLESQNRNE